MVGEASWWYGAPQCAGQSMWRGRDHPSSLAQPPVESDEAGGVRLCEAGREEEEEQEEGEEDE